MQKKLILILLGGLFFSSLQAQYTTDKLVGDKNAHEIDSLKTVDYPYLLPIWGKKVAQKGFKLPKPVGLSMQYIWQESDIIIDNLKVGFNNGPLYDLDDIVRFDNAKTKTAGINIRPDFWLFPFLNIYAIFARSDASTAINAGVWVPDSAQWNKILDINTEANFEATTAGFGLTPTVGISGFFLALDMNFAWTDISELDKPAYTFIFGPRLGKNFVLNTKKPDRNIAVWAGGFRVKLNSGTVGSISTADLFPTDEWGNKINTGYAKVAESQQKVDAWWAGLSPTDQRNPVNIAKHQAADAALAKAGGILDQASQIVSNVGGGSVQYSLDKRPKEMWNFIIGSQFQLNRSWMLRAEYGFLGARQQFIGGLQYRFNF